MHIKEIEAVKAKLEMLKTNRLIKDWKLPYENLLTRLGAAIFFIDPASIDEERLSEVWDQLNEFDNFSYRLNGEKKISALPYRITFNKEEKDKNSSAVINSTQPESQEA